MKTKVKEIVSSQTFKKSLLFFIPLIILSIILLTFWPGIYTYDGNVQWQQVVSNNINNGHPFLSTYVLLILSKIWNSQTILFIVQITLFSFIWKAICTELMNENKNYKTIIIYTILLCLFPIISIYAITAWKDVIYSYCLLALSYFLYRGSKDNYNYSKIQFCLIGILTFFVFSYRFNGKIVAVLFLIFLGFLILKNKNKDNIKKSLIVVVTFISLFVIVSIPKNYYLSKNKTNNETKTASISVIDAYLTWIMGAHIQKDYIEDDDLKFLNNYIKIDEWKEVYTPFLINATNLAETRDNAYIVKNIDEFRQIFIKYTIKHPLTFVTHYLKSDALLWSPLPVGYVYQYDFKVWGPDYGFGVQDTSKLPLLNKIYEKGITLTMRRPIRIILYQPATIMYISIILTFLLAKSLKNKKFYVVLIPMLFNIISLLPINLAQDLRYVYINYLTLGFVGILFVVNIKAIMQYLKTIFKHKRSKNEVI